MQPHGLPCSSWILLFKLRTTQKHSSKFGSFRFAILFTSVIPLVPGIHDPSKIPPPNHFTAIFSVFPDLGTH